MRRKTSKRRIERLWMEVLNSKRWTKMKLKMGHLKDPGIRPIEFRQMSATLAIAGPEMTINTQHFLRSKTKDLKHTLIHEIIHYYLSDNAIEHTSHGKEFKECCKVMGLKNPWAHEAHWKYKFSCACGWWLKTNRNPQEVTCGKCQKILVSPSNYAKIKKTGILTKRIGKGDIGKGKKGIVVTYEASPEKYAPWKKKVN